MSIISSIVSKKCIIMFYCFRLPTMVKQQESQFFQTTSCETVRQESIVFGCLSSCKIFLIQNVCSSLATSCESNLPMWPEEKCKQFSFFFFFLKLCTCTQYLLLINQSSPLLPDRRCLLLTRQRMSTADDTLVFLVPRGKTSWLPAA